MATNYILTVHFSEAAIEVLRQAGEQVAIVRLVAPNQPSDLVWATFFPRTVSTVTWTEEEFSIFAYAKYQENGVTIEQGGLTAKNHSPMWPVVVGGMYSFGDDASFVRMPGDAGPGKVIVTNNGPNGLRDHVQIGLAQDGTVFGDQQAAGIGPVSLVKVPYNKHVTFNITKRVRVFTGDMTMTVWAFLDSDAMSNALDVDFTHSYEHAIGYDTSLNQFTLLS